MSNDHENLTPREQAALDIIGRHTPAAPVTIGGLQLLLVEQGHKRPTERAVKKMVERLRLAGHQVGSSRGEWGEQGEMLVPPGYYLARTEAERRAALRSYMAQVYTSLRLARVFAKGMKEDVKLKSAFEQLQLIDL